MVTSTRSIRFSAADSCNLCCLSSKYITSTGLLVETLKCAASDGQNLQGGPSNVTHLFATSSLTSHHVLPVCVFSNVVICLQSRHHPLFLTKKCRIFTDQDVQLLICLNTICRFDYHTCIKSMFLFFFYFSWCCHFKVLLKIAPFPIYKELLRKTLQTNNSCAVLVLLSQQKIGRLSVECGFWLGYKVIDDLICVFFNPGKLNLYSWCEASSANPSIWCLFLLLISRGSLFFYLDKDPICSIIEWAPRVTMGEKKRKKEDQLLVRWHPWMFHWKSNIYAFLYNLSTLGVCKIWSIISSLVYNSKNQLWIYIHILN